ncbi:MAG: hypothetical protein E6J87_02770 [Deltaproteobacteria bacterium]|jgi:hypothetical protein|nr:MAG: hypothetical protein E6J87_02770 [Deltaproteobacteria bacterium]
MRRVAAALLCSLALSGCLYQIKQVGDDRFLTAPIDWQPGKTTVRDVVDAFGPPDVIRWSAGRLLFVYRAERQVVTSLVLSFYLKVFSNEAGRHEDGTLIVAFDDRDRLVYYGVSEHPREDLAGDLGLRR